MFWLIKNRAIFFFHEELSVTQPVYYHKIVLSAFTRKKDTKKDDKIYHRLY